jgi:cytochrome b561
MTAGNNIEDGLAYPTTDASAGPAYTMTARALHWTTAFLVLSVIPLGMVGANDWGGSMQDVIYDLHRSVGATIVPLIVFRLIYRWTTSAYRASVTVFGWFELPPIWPENRALSEQLFFVHRLMGLAITCLVAAHIGAALYHHLVRKDRILMRMVTG